MKPQFQSLGLFCLITLISGCYPATSFYASKDVTYKGKKVAIYKFNIVDSKTAAKLPEISRQATESFYPFLINANFEVYNLQLEENIELDEAIKKADELKLDYLIVGTGRAHQTGSSVFIDNLNVKFVNTKTLKLDISAASQGVAKRIGDITNQIGRRLVAETKPKL